MKTYDRSFRNQAIVWFMVILIGTMGALAGCATLPTEKTGDITVKTIWQARDQYVSIVKQEHPAGVVTPPNAHPADIAVDRLRSALESIDARIPEKDAPIRVFNDPELKILSENIREGLASAGPDEDVTFAVIGHYTALLGLLKERKVTAGRVFCRDGQINIIFGDILRDVKENEDRRLWPFVPGSRGAESSHSWTLIPSQDGETFARVRNDWITFPLTAPPANPAKPAVPVPSRETGRTGTVNKGSAPAPPPEKPAISGKKSIEERLMILNGLKDKNLITDEEYKEKRREIMNEL